MSDGAPRTSEGQATLPPISRLAIDEFYLRPVHGDWAARLSARFHRRRHEHRPNIVQDRAGLVVRTLGIDLASQASQTAACAVVWAAGGARVESIESGLDDGQLWARMDQADLTGIDAPFGWPIPFVEWLVRSHGGDLDSNSGAVVPAWDADHVRRLRFRLTDYAVRERTGRWPLSVATDLISIVAMRCTGLLQGSGVQDKLGGDGVVEVYPALALRVWGLPALGYKGAGNAAMRERVLRDGLLARCPWLVMTDADIARCIRSDHMLDAFVASLVARCFGVELVEPIPETDREIARREGWIVIPTRDALDGIHLPR